jgi:hypothetical protein
MYEENENAGISLFEAEEPILESQGEVEETQEQVNRLWERDESTNEQSEDEKRYQYWQSKFTKMQQEAEMVRKQNEELQLYAPVARYLQQNPQAISALEQQLKGNQVVAEPQKVAEPSIEKPKAPNYEDFNFEEDPRASVKFAQAQSKYMSDLEGYTQGLVESRTSRIEAQLREQQLAEEQRRRDAQLAYELNTRHKMQPEEIQEFYSMLNTRNESMEDLVNYYRFKKGAYQPINQQKTAQMVNQIQNSRIPPPVGVSGITSKTLSDEDAFNLSLMAWKR